MNRRLKFILDQQDRALDQQATAQALQENERMRDPFGVGGMSGADSFNPFGVYGDSPQGGSSTSPLLLLGGIALVGGAGYLIYKNKKKK